MAQNIWTPGGMTGGSLRDKHGQGMIQHSGAQTSAIGNAALAGVAGGVPILGDAVDIADILSGLQKIWKGEEGGGWDIASGSVGLIPFIGGAMKQGMRGLQSITPKELLPLVRKYYKDNYNMNVDVSYHRTNSSGIDESSYRYGKPDPTLQPAHTGSGQKGIFTTEGGTVMSNNPVVDAYGKNIYATIYDNSGAVKASQSTIDSTTGAMETFVPEGLVDKIVNMDDIQKLIRAGDL